MHVHIKDQGASLVLREDEQMPLWGHWSMTWDRSAETLMLHDYYIRITNHVNV